MKKKSIALADFKGKNHVVVLDQLLTKKVLVGGAPGGPRGVIQEYAGDPIED